MIGGRHDVVRSVHDRVAIAAAAVYPHGFNQGAEVRKLPVVK